MSKSRYCSNLKTFSLCIATISSLLAFVLAQSGRGKVLEINDRLTEFVEKHPDKNWLIKFYAPWCHHCQQLETTYNNVAERIYQEHGNLVVGRVDCTKHGRICEHYNVDSYPTIVHIDGNTTVKYHGDRSELGIISFADRLQGPNVNRAQSCKDIKDAQNNHGLIVLSTLTDPENALRKQFETLAKAYKSSYWFYQFTGSCEDQILEENLYLLKKHLKKPLRFPQLKEVANDDLERALIEWLNKESFPVYGQVSYRNIDRILKSGKLIVLAVLDEYKPARRFTSSSQTFHSRVEKLAQQYSESDDPILFGWSSDLDLVEYFTISQVSLPNVLLLKSDLSYHLLDESGNRTRRDKESPGEESSVKLGLSNLQALINAAKNNQVSFKGGNGYMYVIMRHFVSNLNKFLNMYRANPLLVSLIFGFPSLILIFVIYTTCVHGGPDLPRDEDYSDLEEESDEYDEERQLLLNENHLKQE